MKADGDKVDLASERRVQYAKVISKRFNSSSGRSVVRPATATTTTISDSSFALARNAAPQFQAVSNTGTNNHRSIGNNAQTIREIDQVEDPGFTGDSLLVLVILRGVQYESTKSLDLIWTTSASKVALHFAQSQATKARLPVQLAHDWLRPSQLTSDAPGKLPPATANERTLTLAPVGFREHYQFRAI